MGWLDGSVGLVVGCIVGPVGWIVVSRLHGQYLYASESEPKVKIFKKRTKQIKKNEII